MAHAELALRLERHLQEWLGAWPPPPRGLMVVGSPSRSRPSWDGSLRTVVGVLTGGGGILSVPIDWAGPMEGATDMAEASVLLARLSGDPGAKTYDGVFRWCQELVGGDDSGEWVSVADPRVPSWLHPFGGEVLIAWDQAGRYGAGVGRKQHDRWGQELSVGTEPGLRGRGLGRRLVAQAARRVYREGAVATYLHASSNLASAAVAEASGFPDDGWRVVGMTMAGTRT